MEASRRIVASTLACPAAAAPSDASPRGAVSARCVAMPDEGRSRVVVPPVAAAPAATLAPRATRPRREWRVIVGLDLAARAHALRTRRELVCCVGCGRAGRVAAVEVKRQLWVDPVPWPRRTGGR